MIPVVDFTLYCLEKTREEADLDQIKSLADQICHAFTDVGFVYLKHHGIPKSCIENIFSLSREFFEKPVDVKQRYAKPPDNASYHGWIALEREKLDPERPANDLKEAFNFQVDKQEVIPLDLFPTFYTEFSEFFKQCQEYACIVFDLMSMGLNIDRDYFRECHQLIGKPGNATTLRSLFYPSPSNGVKPGQVRCGEHSDYGTVTLLFQDDIGGLEVKPSSRAEYVPVEPIPDTVLVNLGDLMQRWTADKLVATQGHGHREMIPVVDFTLYCLEKTREEADLDQIKSLADQICHAFTDVGFVYLKHHGIPKSCIENIFSLSRKFFEKPVDVKQRYAKPPDNASYHGWIALEREKLDPERPANDLKEAFNFQVDKQEVIPLDLFPTFYTEFSEFFKQCQELACRVLDLMSMGLNIDRDYFRECHQLIGKPGNATTLRSLFYPSPSNGVKPGQVRCGEHSDYGTVTLLFQDDIGGLEVKPSSRAEYVPVEPIPDTVLVNLGDLMQRWTADKLVATKHRVLIPEEEFKRSKVRQSLAFFVQPDDHVMIECWDKSNKYEPITSGDYLKMRFAATY